MPPFSSEQRSFTGKTLSAKDDKYGESESVWKVLLSAGFSSTL